jgi:hypothetical protein
MHSILSLRMLTSDFYFYFKFLVGFFFALWQQKNCKKMEIFNVYFFFNFEKKLSNFPNHKTN